MADQIVHLTDYAENRNSCLNAIGSRRIPGSGQSEATSDSKIIGRRKKY